MQDSGLKDLTSYYTYTRKRLRCGAKTEEIRKYLLSKGISEILAETIINSSKLVRKDKLNKAYLTLIFSSIIFISTLVVFVLLYRNEHGSLFDYAYVFLLSTGCIELATRIEKNTLSLNFKKHRVTALGIFSIFNISAIAFIVSALVRTEGSLLAYFPVLILVINTIYNISFITSITDRSISEESDPLGRNMEKRQDTMVRSLHLIWVVNLLSMMFFGHYGVISSISYFFVLFAILSGYSVLSGLNRLHKYHKFV